MLDEQGNEWIGQEVSAGDDSGFSDKSTGQERIIRTFVIQVDPTKDNNLKEILEFHRKNIEDIIVKSGWVMERDLEISKMNNNQVAIIAVCKPAMIHGTIIGATNDSPVNANEILQDKQ